MQLQHNRPMKLMIAVLVTATCGPCFGAFEEPADGSAAADVREMILQIGKNSLTSIEEKLVPHGDLAVQILDEEFDGLSRLGRRVAISVFEAVSSDRAVQALIEKHTYRNLWFVIWPALRNIGDRAVEPLLESLSSRDPLMRQFAVCALARINIDGIDDILVGNYVVEEDFNTIHEYIRNFRYLKDERSLKLLIDEARAKDWFRSLLAFRSLKERKDPGCTDDVRAIFEDSEMAMRRRIDAASVLAVLGHDDAMEFLFKGAFLDSDHIRSLCVNHIAGMKNPGNEGFLIDKLEDKSRSVRVSALFALWEMGTPKASKALEKLLDDEDKQIRSLAELAVIGLRDLEHDEMSD